MERDKLMKILYSLLLLATGNAYAQDTAKKVYRFSLAQAMEFAKQHSYQVKNAILDIQIQKQVNRDITSVALPQINGSGGVTHYIDIPVTLIPGVITGLPEGTFTPVQFGTKWNSNAGLGLSQLLFDGQVFIALKARNRTMDLARKQLEFTEQTIRTNVYKIYYQLVAGNTQLQLIDSNISRFQKLKADNEVMYANGFIEKLDINRVTVQIANLQTLRINVFDQIINGYSGLKVLMGMPIRDSLILSDSITDQSIKEGILENSQYRYSDRKEFQVLEITNILNALNVRRYKLSQLPSLSFSGNYIKQAQRNKFDLVGRGSWFTTSFIGLQLNVPIFNGGALRARTQKARYELQQSQNQTEALKLRIDSEVQTSINTFTSSVAALEYQKQNMQLAELVFNQTKKKFEIGTGSTTEINSAQLELQTAQTNYIQALYDAIIAKADFLQATGKF